MAPTLILVSTVLGGLVAAAIIARSVWHAIRWAIAVLSTLSAILEEMHNVRREVTDHRRRIEALERRRGA